jgi:hypothetical protein
MDEMTGNAREQPPRGGWRVHPTLQWVQTASLLIIALVLWLRADGRGGTGLVEQALAQPVQLSGARGVFAFSGPLSKGTFGVFLVDVDAMTIWAYEYNPQKGCLELAAARTWRYDRYLENLNTCGPSPGDIEELIDNQRKSRMEGQTPGAP